MKLKNVMYSIKFFKIKKIIDCFYFRLSKSKKWYAFDCKIFINLDQGELNQLVMTIPFLNNFNSTAQKI